MTTFALDLTPDKAIEFLESKRAFVRKLDKPALQGSARARAARIANLSSLEMTADIYHSMAEAKRNQQPYNEWKKGVLAMLERKGWVAGRDEHKELLLADPSTGEIFGTPRRLETIYRTNMQAAFSAQEYQQLMDNVDDRPFWQYSAILDSRTRPRHSAMHGLVYRYDDPFWATFYPPNGFNCRCTVKALKRRDLDRKGLTVGDSRGRLVDTKVSYKKGETTPTKGLKMADGSVLVADKGFDYNVGRISYRPNLDQYPEPLAHQFAKVEMAGGEFEWAFEKLQKAVAEVKARLGNTGKLSADEMLIVREQLRLEFKFAAGRIADNDAALMGLNTKTAWLSDDTLIKQFNSRTALEDFGMRDYALLPEMLYKANHIFSDGKNFTFVKRLADEDYYLMGVVKHIPESNELFVVSYRKCKQKEVDGLMKRLTVIR